MNQMAVTIKMEKAAGGTSCWLYSLEVRENVWSGDANVGLLAY